VVVGPGNKYVAAAKRLLYGEVGIDFVAGPTDVLIVADASAEPDWWPPTSWPRPSTTRTPGPGPWCRPRFRRARLRGGGTSAGVPVHGRHGALFPGRRRLADLYSDADQAVAAADAIAPEHLELHGAEAESWAPRFRNFGSLFIGSRSAEVLGDYSAGINHTLPTSGSARFTGGLSVRHFLKTATTLRCSAGEAYERAGKAAELIAAAEGLAAHGASAAARRNNKRP
jgi:histidinol dehydrogenase